MIFDIENFSLNFLLNFFNLCSPHISCNHKNCSHGGDNSANHKSRPCWKFLRKHKYEKNSNLNNKVHNANAPQSPTEELHPCFLEAIKNLDIVEYYLDCSVLPDPQTENELRKYWEGLHERLEKEERRLA